MNLRRLSVRRLACFGWLRLQVLMNRTATDIKKFKFRGAEFTFTGDPTDEYFKTLEIKLSGLLGYFDLLDKILPRDGAVVDVGANLGLTSVALGKLHPNITIYAVEPAPHVFANLAKNIAANGTSNVHPFNRAISDSNGTLEFHEDAFSAGSHVVTNEHMVAASVTTTKVTSCTLESLLAERNASRVDFVKIDVEGFEFEVLSGMREVVEKFKPTVFMEFNSFTTIAFGNKNPRVLLDAFRKMFPHVEVVGQGKRLETDDDYYRFLHDNLVHHNCADDLIGFSR